MYPFPVFPNGVPYTNFHELNNDWLIRTVKSLELQFPGFIDDLNKKLNKPVINPDGTLNDILLSNGDGSTRWESLQNTIIPQIQAAVDAWLDAHPEATTTVQDGTITPAKLNTELFNLYKQAGKVQFFFPYTSDGTYSASCCMMVTPRKTVLFDCGIEGDENIIIPFFTALYEASVFTNIDMIVISHYHADHIGLLEDFLQQFPHVGCHLYIPISPSGYYVAAQDPSLITAYNTVITIADDNQVAYTVIDTDTTLVLDPDYVTMQLLNSTTTSYQYYSNQQATYNDYSMYALVKIGNTSVLFPGDGQNMSQQYVMSLVDLPRLFLYPVHHHGIQNDDYVPYIEKINPTYSIISTSHARQLASARASMFTKVADTLIGSTAYDWFSFVCDGKSGDITHGSNMPYSGWLNTNITLYVNNEYTGTDHDGTSLRPFTSINEAIMFCQDRRNLKYTIQVKKTDTTYEGTFIRDYDRPVVINGLDGAPSIDNFYIQNSPDVKITGFKINGTGYPNYPANNQSAGLVVLESGAVITNCEIDGTNFTNTAYAGAITGSNLTLKNTTIKNLAYGFYPTTNYEAGISTIVTRSCTFISISDTVFTEDSIKHYIQDGNTFTSITTLVRGSTVHSIPANIHRDILTPANAALCTVSAVSEITYKDANHPCVMLSKQNIYDVLTGTALT